MLRFERRLAAGRLLCWEGDVIASVGISRFSQACMGTIQACLLQTYTAGIQSVCA